MDSAALDSLTPFLEGIDQWAEIAPLLPLIVVLEIVLSADNAVALASITRGLNSSEDQKTALNLGILLALVLRVLLLLTANYIIKYSYIKILASLYLYSIIYNNYRSKSITNLNNESKDNNGLSMLRVIALLSFTDLAFSIDSVTAAVAISDQILLILTGTLVGVIALRFTSGLFIDWLQEYLYLEDAGYIAVGLVASKLLLISLFPNLVIKDIYFFALVVLIFVWGFSKKQKVN